MTHRTIGLLVTLALGLFVMQLAAAARTPGNILWLGIRFLGSPPARPREGAHHASPFIGGPLWQMCRACPTLTPSGGIVRRV
jgi:hypothetical protein